MELISKFTLTENSEIYTPTSTSVIVGPNNLTDDSTISLKGVKNLTLKNGSRVGKITLPEGLETLTIEDRVFGSEGTVIPESVTCLSVSSPKTLSLLIVPSSLAVIKIDAVRRREILEKVRANLNAALKEQELYGLSEDLVSNSLKLLEYVQ